jgi:hypothetical protein
VRVIWTPYERIVYLLWHVRVEVAPAHDPGSVVRCELPVRSAGVVDAPDTLAVVLDLPNSLRSVKDVLAHQATGCGVLGSVYIPGLNDCRHHAIATLRFLYPRDAE